MADPMLATFPLGMPWETSDPFLFCVHHRDDYPRGDDRLGPAAPLRGRDIGMDFAGIDGWNMYHGDVVPGFPRHPHRGFETITFVRSGYVDHSDSLGAIARYGPGDTQWLTAGGGIVHAEMFPLLHSERDNPLELFQIWLNLAAEDKFADPHFSMLWQEEIPRHRHTDDAGTTTTVTVVAGTLGDLTPPPPPPDSWASRHGSDVAVWHVEMQAGASWTLPPAVGAETRRHIYVADGPGVGLDGHPLSAGHGAEVVCDRPIELAAAESAVSCLVLQGRPIGEPVAKYGPFVMNREEELARAFADYRATEFGGWPWPSDGPTNGAETVRFAQQPDGSRVAPPTG